MTPVRPIMLRCRGRRIYTNLATSGDQQAMVCDENDRPLAGPFALVEDAVAWVLAHSPPRAPASKGR